MKNHKNKQKPHICALILAGGLSSRMNSKDKGLSEINGISFVEHIALQLESQVNEVFISTNKNQNTYQTMGFECINDQPFPSEGPLCAIAAGLEKISCDYLLIVPCDNPNIADNLVKQLYNQLKIQHADISSILHKGKIQPLFTLIKSELKNSAKESIKLGLRKTQDWILKENHFLVEDNNEDHYLNINTQEELKYFMERKKSQ